MSVLLRSLLTVSFASLVLVGCGEKPTEPVAEATPAVETAPAVSATEVAPVASATEAATEPGGYVPTPEERVPGITLDTSAQPVTEATPATPAEVAPAEAAPAQSDAQVAPEAK